MATMLIVASTSTRCWPSSGQVLVSKLRQVEPDAVLVIDNLRPHHAPQVRQLLDEAGIGLMYLPQYSPEFKRSSTSSSRVHRRRTRTRANQFPRRDL